MIKLTLQEAWARQNNTTGHALYLYRNGETVLYVGVSSTPLERLRQHLMPSNSTPIGKAIREQFPDSLQWALEILSLDECQAIAREYSPEHYKAFRKKNKRMDWVWELAEKALIIQHRPPYNTVHNPDKELTLEQYLTATQAASRIGVNEKTVRRWIDEGKMEAMHIKQNRLAIPLSEVERVTEEHSSTHLLPGRDEDITGRLEALEKQVSDLAGQIAALREQKPAPPVHILRPPRAEYRTEVPAGSEALPAGWVSLKNFYHEVPRQTALRWVEHLVKRGRWIHEGHEVSIALDAAGQASAYEVLRTHPAFKPCADCPHAIFV